MVSLTVTGKVRNRFVHAAVLLRTLDPVRGEPTAHPLDLNDIGLTREHLLKRKFLDSFALICAVRKGGDSVSAACMEEGQPEGTVIRMASNAGVRETVLSDLRSIISDLNSIASGESDEREKEGEILLKIIQLDIVRIRQYIKVLYEDRRKVTCSRSEIEKGILAFRPDTPKADIERFSDWLDDIDGINSPDLQPQSLVAYIRLTQEARQNHVDSLNAVFRTQTGLPSKWVSSVFKLGRYGIASRAFVQLAVEFPALFNPMTVEAIAAPEKTTFPQDDISLGLVLRRLVGNDEQEYLSRLSSVWSGTEPEAHFRQQCPNSLTVHAEIQLLGFYDLYPPKTPSFRFIGVSKKSCYLCDKFLAIHPQCFRVSACHQKLYVSWIPPHTADNRIYVRYRDLTTKLARILEAEARQDLLHRLGSPRRQVPADSSGGVSLSGLAEPGPVRPGSRVAIRSQVDPRHFALKQNELTTWEIRNAEESEFSHPSQVTKSMPSKEARDPTYGDLSATSPIEQPSGNGIPCPFLDMVLHFVRSGDLRSQDIVCVADIIDPGTQKLSWAKLVSILETNINFGIGFNSERDFLMVENRIIIDSERQLVACLQHLRNKDKLNGDVSVCRRQASSRLVVRTILPGTLKWRSRGGRLQLPMMCRFNATSAVQK